MSPERKNTSSLLTPEMICSFLETSPDCICVVSPEGVLDYCNPAYLKLFGYGPEELVGLHLNKLPFFSESQSRSILNMFAKVASGSSDEILEYSATRKNGEKIRAETRAAALMKGGELFGVQMVTRDCTLRSRAMEQLKKNIQRIEDMLGGLTDPLLLHRMSAGDTPGKIVFCNQKAA